MGEKEVTRVVGHEATRCEVTDVAGRPGYACLSLSSARVGGGVTLLHLMTPVQVGQLAGALYGLLERAAGATGDDLTDVLG